MARHRARLRRSRRRWLRLCAVTVTALTAVTASVLTVAPASAAGLSDVSWTASSAQTGAALTTYDYSFTASSAHQISSIVMTLPSGTSGTPVLRNAVAEADYVISLAAASVALSGTTLSVSFTSVYIPTGSRVSLQIGGLSNTAAPGSYSSSITTRDGTTPVGSATTAPFRFSTSPLTVYWSPSTSLTSASSVSYRYSLTTASAATVSALTFTLPAGTTGSPTVVSASPSALLTAATVTRSGTTLTYSFTPTSIVAGTEIELTIAGLTNTPRKGRYAQQAVTWDGAAAVDSGVSAPVSLTSTGLTALTWSASSNAVGDSGTRYTFGFTTATAKNPYSSFTFTVPPGTSGTPTLGTSSVIVDQNNTFPLASSTVTLSGQLLTLSFTPRWIDAGAVATIEVLGLTNTARPGSYASVIASTTNGLLLNSGVAPAVTFSSTHLTSLSWSASSTAASAANVKYTYSFGLSTTSSATRITIGVPPGTGGTPVAGSIAPAAIAGGSVTLAGNTLTYTFPSPQTISSTSTITMQITGITNTSTPSSYAAPIVVFGSDAGLASGTTPTVSFTSSVLGTPSWTSLSTLTGQATTYTWAFSTTSDLQFDSVTMTVPTGTSGTAHLGTIAVVDSALVGQSSITLSDMTVRRSGTLITFAFTAPTWFHAGTTFSLELTGLITTPDAGTYTSSIAARNGVTAVSSATTPALSFSSVSLGAPTWSVSPSTLIGATGIAYTYEFVVSVSSSVSAITISLPQGTSGTPSVTAVSPSALAGGSIEIKDGALVYSIPPTAVPFATHVILRVGGMTNTTVAHTFSSTITLKDAGTAILASGVTTEIYFTSAALTGVSWTVSSLKSGATGVIYTYGLTTSTPKTITSITMTVPAGTSGTPVLSSIEQDGTPLSAGASLVDTTLTVSLSTAQWFDSGSAFLVTIGGMTNTTEAGNYTSAIATRLSGTRIDSGTTDPVLFVGGPLAGASWSVSHSTAGTANTSYSYAFTTRSTSPLTSITMSVPGGTSGTPVIGALSPAALARAASATLAGGVLTVTFPATTIEGGTAVELRIDGLTNTMATARSSASIVTRNGADTIDTGLTAPVSILAQALSFTNSCTAAGVSCTLDPTGATKITLLVIPGWSTPVSAATVLAIHTNAADGYRVQARMSPLESVNGGGAIGSAPVGRRTDPGADEFYAQVSLSASPDSGAVLCSPYGSSTPSVGYPAAPAAASIWLAASGSGTDQVVVNNYIRVSQVQPAGRYEGTISYSVEPSYTGEPAC